MYKTHVYLGPSLDIARAKTLLPNAHYHPPIQCGDIIRLLRLEPQKIIIIDGLYEVVPAVWHKEILIAIDLGIEVWGAGSMGALRAAELYPYGMKGFGVVFNDFKTGKLNDDDEVAVLHRGIEEQHSPINDAMVNIRATCEQAYQEGALTQEEKNNLIKACKDEFYPHRSIKKAIKTWDTKHAFVGWFSKHGLMDIKKQDAMGVLTHHQNLTPELKPNTNINQHLTVYLREIIQYADVTPFQFQADWLPPIEKNLQALFHKKPKQYMLVAELAFFTRKLCSIKPTTEIKPSIEDIHTYIKLHNLYSPTVDFLGYNPCDLLVGQTICALNLKSETINLYLPVIAHYYDLELDIAADHSKLLRILLVLMLAINHHSGKSNTHASENVAIHHCQEVMRRRNYSPDKFKSWFQPTHFPRQLFINFLMNYMTTLRGTYYRSNTVLHHRWIYDAYLFYSKEVKYNQEELTHV